jgi:mRNA interferase YafQ
MRTIERTNQFKRDFTREMKGRHRGILEAALLDVVTVLAADAKLPEKYRDHSLGGAWQDCRDCHLKPDLVLIYRNVGTTTLQLIRLASHSELTYSVMQSGLGLPASQTSPVA